MAADQRIVMKSIYNKQSYSIKLVYYYTQLQHSFTRGFVKQSKLY